LTDSSQIRQTSNAPSVPSSSTILSKLRPNNVQFGRSQSQADLPYSSKLSQQRTTSNNSLGTNVLSSPSTSATPSNDHLAPGVSKTPPSSATTALTMINKHYKNNSSSSLPTVSNHHRHHANKISLSDKQYSNHT
jgi:hypothetical protein